MENGDGQYGSCGHRAHGGLTTVVACCLQLDMQQLRGPSVLRKDLIKVEQEIDSRILGTRDKEDRSKEE